MNELETAHRRLKAKYERIRKRMKELDRLARVAYPYMTEHAKNHGGLEPNDYQTLWNWIEDAKSIFGVCDD